MSAPDSPRGGATYKCNLCGVDHPIVDGRVEHTGFEGDSILSFAQTPDTTREEPTPTLAESWTQPKGTFPGVWDYNRELVAGDVVRKAVEHDSTTMRFYLTCSVGELAQRVVIALAPPEPPAVAANPAPDERLRELALAATPGPWFAKEFDKPQWGVNHSGHDYAFVALTSQGNDEANARYLAACQPDVILALLAECAALRASSDTRWGLIDTALTTMREPMTLEDARLARGMLTSAHVAEKKRRVLAARLPSSEKREP